MSSVKIGWYFLEESFAANGDIDLAIRDKRSGETLAVTLESFEQYDRLLDTLNQNHRVGTLSRLAQAC